LQASHHATAPGVYFQQVADIEIWTATPWEGIATYSDCFKGTYDGNGKKLTYLNTADNADGESLGGLFAATEGAVLKNIILVEPYGEFDQSGTSPAGLLAGAVWDSEVENCHVVGGYIWHDKLSAGSAGLVGEVKSSLIKNCSVDVTIAAATNSADLGGLAAQIYYYGGEPSYIEDCSVAIFVQESTSPGVGGFAGLVSGPAHIKRCSAVGVILPEGDVNTAGGFIARLEQAYYSLDTDPDITIENCYAAVDLISSGQMTDGAWGGFIGQISTSTGYPIRITNCYSAGIVHQEVE
jgi:hypothetical protein